MKEELTSISIACEPISPVKQVAERIGSETPKKNETQLKRSGSQQKRKATAFLVDFKDATFPAPVTPALSVIHSDFEGFRERSKAIARTSPLDFATQKAESL